MKKFLVLSLALALSLALLHSPVQAQIKLGFKVTGGLGYLRGGDLNTGLQGWSDMWKLIFSLAGRTSTGGYSPVHLGLDLGGELLIQFNPSLALGLGVSSLQAAKTSTLAASGWSTTLAPKVRAIPITATVYYFLPGSGAARIFLDAGIGYYLGRYQDSWQMVYLGTIDESLDTTAGGIGFHGGLGIEIPFSPAFSFLAEARGRYASLGSFKGTAAVSSTTITGSVWLQDFTNSESGTSSYLTVKGTTPTGTNVRPAKLDLSGFSVVIGLLFRL
jgi:opacity protein-like surface antigen